MIPLDSSPLETLGALLPEEAPPPRIPSRRQGAVLLPLVSTGGEDLPGTFRESSVLFTLRTETVATHKGEVSFPGGRIEQGETPAEAALRETAEELGLPLEKIRFIGFLGTFPTSTTAWEIRAALGILPGKGWTPMPKEVEEAFLVPLPELIETRKAQRLAPAEPGPPWPTFLHRSGDRRFTIWGATARILAAFLDLLLDADP